MNKILIIAWHEYLTNVRRGGFIFVTALFPAMGLIALLVTAFFSGQAANFFQTTFAPQGQRTAIVDRSGLYTQVPPQYAGRFVLMPDEVAAKSALLAGQVNSYVVIPRDYVTSGKITSYAMGGLTSATSGDSGALRGFLVFGLVAGKVDPDLAARASAPVHLTPVTLDKNGNPSGGTDTLSFVSGFIVPYFLSILLVISIFTSSSYLLRSISEEKETRVIEIVLSSVSATQLLGGKVIGLGAVGLTQIAVWIMSAFLLSGGLGVVAAGVAISLNPGTFLLAGVYFLLGFLVFGVVMAAAGAIGTSMRESQQIAGIFSFAAAIPYMLSGFLFANPNATIARVLSYFPLTAPTMMMLRLPLGDVPAVDIVGSIAVLLVSIPVLLWAGAKVFRMGLLMYGKRPAARQILRAIRQA